MKISKVTYNLEGRGGERYNISNAGVTKPRSSYQCYRCWIPSMPKLDIEEPIEAVEIRPSPSPGYQISGLDFIIQDNP